MSQPESAIRWHKRHAVQRLSRLLDRIVKMRLPEIKQRLQLRVRRMPGLKDGYRHKYQQQSEAAARWFADAYGNDPVTRLSSNFNQKFVYGPAHRKGVISALDEHCPEGKNRTLQLADELLDGCFTLLGQRVKLVDNKIDWHADPKTGAKNWPLEFMDENDAITLTSQDVKYVWEVNRHQFIPMLGRAYWISDDPKYVQAAQALILDWIEKNPAGVGVNWCSHLEVAMRATSWLWAMPFLLDERIADKTFVKTWLGSIAQHYYHLSKNLSVFTDPTNHLVGETTALWLLTSCLPELPEAQQQNQRCRAILLQHLKLQTHKDGVNKEQASSYHRFVTDFYVQLLCVSRRQPNPLPNHAVELVEKMLEYCAALAGTHGTAPMVGDSDDARGIPMPESFGWDFRDTVTTGAILFERFDFARATFPLSSSAIWLLGKNCASQYAKLQGGHKPAPATIFEVGGMCFLSNRSGNAELIFDVGELGLWPNASHGHADALNVIARVNGKLLMVDPGTGSYFESQEIRDWFRHTASHNTVTVDGLDQSDIHDTFKWVNPFDTIIEEKLIDDELCYVSASHNGYTRLREAVTHRRSVLSASMNGWIIIDEIEGVGVHSVERNFHFAPAVSSKSEKPGLFEIKDTESGEGLRVYLPLTDTDESHLPNITSDSRNSNQYGSSCETIRLRQRWKGPLPQTMITIIEPIQDTGREESEPDYSTVWNDDTGSLVVVCSREHNMQLFLINPQCNDVALPQKMRSNASFLYVDTLGETIQQVFIRGAGSTFSAPGFELNCDTQQSFISYQHSTRDKV